VINEKKYGTLLVIKKISILRRVVQKLRRKILTDVPYASACLRPLIRIFPVFLF